ncbi:PIN domain-containing protein [Streptomyces chartreusis]|uniref:hypothetical protein n=1 Tax=Streptomyces chartreusis TaxID=1969 RepID=UPI00380687DC
MIRVLLDHTCIRALAEGDEFLNGMYIEGSYGSAEIGISALSAVAAERERPGAGQHILGRRFTTAAEQTALFEAPEPEGAGRPQRRGAAALSLIS